MRVGCVSYSTGQGGKEMVMKAKLGIPNGLHYGTWFPWKGKTGVYCIRHKKSGKRYVGSAAICLMSRLFGHRSELRNNRHGNSYLQFAWNKYGETAFVVEVLEFCRPKDCIKCEQKWMDHFQVFVRKFGYNLAPKAGSVLGSKRTKATRRTLSEIVKRYWKELSAEERERISKQRRGRRMTSEQKARNTKRLTKHGHTGGRGGTSTAEYRAWVNLRCRCRNPSHPVWLSWSDTSGVSKVMCGRWNTFVNFLNDMGTKPSSGHQLRRRDVTKPFGPRNCLWAHPKGLKRRRIHASG